MVLRLDCLERKPESVSFIDQFISIISDGIKILYNYIRKTFRIYQFTTENILLYKTIWKTFKLYQMLYIIQFNGKCIMEYKICTTCIKWNVPIFRHQHVCHIPCIQNPFGGNIMSYHQRSYDHLHYNFVSKTYILRDCYSCKHLPLSLEWKSHSVLLTGKLLDSL